MPPKNRRNTLTEQGTRHSLRTTRRKDQLYPDRTKPPHHNFSPIFYYWKVLYHRSNAVHLNLGDQQQPRASSAYYYNDTVLWLSFWNKEQWNEKCAVIPPTRIPRQVLCGSTHLTRIVIRWCWWFQTSCLASWQHVRKFHNLWQWHDCRWVKMWLHCQVAVLVMHCVNLHAMQIEGNISNFPVRYIQSSPVITILFMTIYRI